MPATVPATTVVVSKISATGDFIFLIQNPNGGVRTQFALLSADMATAAALSGGSSATFTYSQDGSPAGPSYKSDFSNLGSSTPSGSSIAWGTP